jgi:hypothetical protein
MDMRRLIAATMVIAVLLVSTSGGLGIACCPNGGEDDGDGNGDNGQTTITPIDSPETPARGYFKGFASILPPSGDFDDAYEQAADHAEFASVWGPGTPGAVWDIGGILTGSWGEAFVEGYVRGNGMFPIVQLSFIDKDETGLILKLPEGMDNATLDDAEWKDAYKQAVLDATEASRPLYLSPGNEVNRWYEQYGAETGDPNGFQHFVSLYEEIYDEVKELSPETMVFPVFSREIVGEYREADLTVLEMFDPDKIDILVFTTYAFAVGSINRVADLPNDYYSEALDHLGVPDKPFGLTEVAWSTLEDFGGEREQAAFLTALVGRFTVDQGVNLHFLAWFVMFDLEDDPHQVALISREGIEKPAYEVWKAL